MSKKSKRFILPEEREIILEALNRYANLNASFGEPISLPDTYRQEGWLACYDWLKAMNKSDDKSKELLFDDPVDVVKYYYCPHCWKLHTREGLCNRCLTDPIFKESSIKPKPTMEETY